MYEVPEDLVLRLRMIQQQAAAAAVSLESLRRLLMQVLGRGDNAHKTTAEAAE
jgi:hypothetical protein